ncbi:MAG: sodium:proton antiporter [Clostridiales Family XIII bacterium]|jgi:Na+/H+ antiporter NhaD/arsenite permease-like protein|nr:sodium:proton antiporter [Clostridiales Family XIII bacterium]
MIKKFISVKLLIILGLLVLLSIPSFLLHGEEVEELGLKLPIWTVLPFIIMLLSIAIWPLIRPHFWDKNLVYIVIIYSLLFLIPFAITFGVHEAGFQFFEIIILDYLPFIILLWGLFAVSGGIALKGKLVGSPKVNLIILLIGTLIASVIGTTGASMLLIRPLLKANAWRKKKVHIVVFFIFLVSNIGGCLSPIGDPPLYLGFLRGVPFFWTLKLFPLLILNMVILLLVFFIIDKRLYKKDIALKESKENTEDDSEKKDGKIKIRIEGAYNFIFIGMIVGAVILSGVFSKMPIFIDDNSGHLKGIKFLYDIVITYPTIIELLIIILAAFLSVKFTKKEIREFNKFTWEPIKEVAVLFIGIFITMIPALAMLSEKGADLGLTKSWEFFWVTGALSSFLDNAPTYLVFMTTAASFNAAGGLMTTVGSIAPTLLIAVSAGSVFMGANTYIGNAPNFMVRSIAIENEVKMPSFFGYMFWSLRFLIPLFIIDTIVLIFFF